jgi:competence protein ComEA
MDRIGRSQILVYGAVIIVVLLIGARWVRGSKGAEAQEGAIAYVGREQAGADVAEEGSGEGRDAIVHVAGAVRRPGVYRLPAGSRVADAIERAGGASPGAEPSAINLAARLGDGQQVVVPERTRGAAALPTDRDSPISLGAATAQELETIEGIGPVTAASIIAFRDERGGLASIEELDQVSGIGPATLEALRGRLQP